MILPRDDMLLAERSWLTSAGKQRWEDRIDEEPNFKPGDGAPC
jgi:hypothetical protein